MTTKIHAVTDGLGNPLAIELTPGNVNDICVAQILLSHFNFEGATIICEKGYNSDKLISFIEQNGGMRYRCYSQP